MPSSPASFWRALSPVGSETAPFRSWSVLLCEDEGFRRVRLVLPPPGVHQPLRRFHYPVHPDQVMLGADPCRVKPARTSTAFAAPLSSRPDLPDRPLASVTRKF